MKNPKLYEYECRKCGNLFNYEDLATISYIEYAGASNQTEEVSPCCHARYRDNQFSELEHQNDIAIKQAEFDDKV